MPDPVRVVLCLMVKNEVPVIRRCLLAALPFVDGVALSSNGDDETVEIAKSAVRVHLGRANSDPVTDFFSLAKKPWRNFGFNRSASFAHARLFAARRQWPLDRTYALFLDADMVLRIGEGTDKQALTAPHYEFLQHNRGETYANTRLARMDLAWHCEGVTHEFWGVTPWAEPVLHPTLDIDDRDDGGSRGDKLERDVALLREGLRLEPMNGRYMFYLGRTLIDLGETEEGIGWLVRRQLIPGWDEEIWYSRYREGLARIADRTLPEFEGVKRKVPGDFVSGMGTLLSAFAERPHRAEPLVAAARWCREHAGERPGLHAVAVLLAREAALLPMPQDRLFVERAAYRQEPLNELAISAYYTPHKKEGHAAAEKLLAMRDVSDWVYENVHRAISFYVEPLVWRREGEFVVPDEIRKDPQPRLGLATPNTTEYLPSNPTLCPIPGKLGAFLVNVRLVNYRHERGRVFDSNDPDKIIRTRNVWGVWDPEKDRLGPLTESRVFMPTGWPMETFARGFEDQRWAHFSGEVWMTGTCFNFPGANQMPRCAIGRLAMNDHGGTIEIYEPVYPFPAAWKEKNWLPWGRDGELDLVYGYEPFRILRTAAGARLDQIACTIVSDTLLPWNASRWRGSAGPVRLSGKDRWLALIHETSNHANHAVYMHRFIEITGNTVTRRSRLFTFEHAGVEYAAGLAILGGDVIVTHSVEESRAKWKMYDLEYVERLLDGGLS